MTFITACQYNCSDRTDTVNILTFENPFSFTNATGSMFRVNSRLRFIQPRLASAIEQPPEGKHWIDEIKLDAALRW